MVRDKGAPALTEMWIVIQHRNERSLTGLEAAIILIAVVVVSAIVLYLIFGAEAFPF